MKTYGKKFLTALLTLVLFISMIPNMAIAASTAETDNNDVPSNATPLTSASPVTGTLSSEEDVDYYKYTVDVTGYYNFTFTNVTGGAGCWDFQVCDSNLNVLEGASIDGYTYTTNTYNFKKGSILYIKVNDKYYAFHGYTEDDYNQDSIGKEYSIAVKATNTSDWEQEDNDTKGTASTIDSKSSMHGNLYCVEDVDYYKYIVDITGYFNFTLTNINAQGGSWDIHLYDSKLNEIMAENLHGYTYTTENYNFKKGTVLFIKVEAHYWSGYDYDTVGEEYTLSVNTKKSSSWEQENNDTYGKATSLKSNTTKYGNMYTSNDLDYYKYTANKTGTLKVSFKYDANDVGRGWAISIFDSSKKEIKTVWDITTDKTISFKAKKGKKYYVVVRVDDDYAPPIGITYELKIK